MARIRTVKPEFWAHPVMSRQEDSVKCLAIALLNLSDDEGYFNAEPALVRSFARPLDEDSTITRRCIDTLQKMDWIQVCEHHQHGLIGRVVSFSGHQSIDRPKPSKIKAYFTENHRRAVDEGSSLEQGTGNREVLTPLPPTGSGDGGRKPRKSRGAKTDSLDSDVPMEVLNAVGEIVNITPIQDRDGRKIRVPRGEVLTRVQSVLSGHPKATPEILVQSWKDYLASDPKAIKAPQYFFGKQEDQGENGANWYPWAKAIFIRSKVVNQ